MPNKIKISMPHRHTVVYETHEIEISFEVELLSDGIVLYTHSPRFTKGEEKELSQEISDVRTWLESKFSKVEIDNSPPPTFMI